MRRRSGNGALLARKTATRRWRPGSLECLEGRVLLSATDYLVDSAGNSTSGTGTSGTLPYVVGLANANPGSDGSVISFSPLFDTPQTITLAGTLELSATAGPEVIVGPGLANLTISGNDSVGVFTVDPGVNATLSGLTIAHGVATDGGGVYVDDGALSISDCAVTNNKALENGGGISDFNGRVQMSQCQVSRNSAVANGGGLEAYSTGNQVTITGSTFVNNKAASGGGVFVNKGSLTISDSTVAGNMASISGGGIYNLRTKVRMTDCAIAGNIAAINGGAIREAFTGAQFTITDSTIVGNRASSGGGIYLTDGSMDITGSTLSSNVARVTDGGGFFESSGDATITNSTISANFANDDGGGMSLAGGTLATVNATVAYNVCGDGSAGGLDVQTGTVAIDNTIVALNYRGFFALIPSDIAGTVSGSYNLIGIGGSGGLTSGSGNQVNVANPVLGLLGNNGGPTHTIALLPGSPAIGAGSDSIPDVTVPLFDQRGVARPPGSIDVGAFQNRGFTMTIAQPTGRQTTAVNTAFAYPFTVIVTSPFGDPVMGGIVTFNAPSNGASAVLNAATATIGAGGRASMGARANGTIGRYVVKASASGAVTSVGFALTNTAGIGRASALLFSATSTVPVAASVPAVGSISQEGTTIEPTWPGADRSPRARRLR